MCNKCEACQNNKSGVLSDVDLKDHISKNLIKIGVSDEYRAMLKKEGFVGEIQEFDFYKQLADPFSEIARTEIGPCSIDLRLGYDFYEYVKPYEGFILDVREMKKNGIPEGAYRRHIINDGQGVVLEPNAFWLGTTLESITVPPSLRALVEGKSTIGRLGIIPHAAAGYIDPGFGFGAGCSLFGNQVTLEIKNLNVFPIRIYPGDYICQMEWSTLLSKSENSYDKRPTSAYTVQVGTKLPTSKNITVVAA